MSGSPFRVDLDRLNPDGRDIVEWRHRGLGYTLFTHAVAAGRAYLAVTDQDVWVRGWPHGIARRMRITGVWVMTETADGHQRGDVIVKPHEDAVMQRRALAALRRFRVQ